MEHERRNTVRSGPLVLALAGDVMLGRLVNEEIARSGITRLWGNMLPWFRQADLRLINLECALTDHLERWEGDPSKPFFFRSDARNVQALNVAGIDFACIANNHIGDFGSQGLMDTIRTLDSAGIKHAGAGADREAARSPVMLESQGYRISVVAFADHPSTWAAGLERPGLYYCSPGSDSPSDFEHVESAIRIARKDCDLLVFTIHWGPNMRARPSVAFQRFAHRVIDAGADIFWGHSAHVVQGIEIYRPVARASLIKSRLQQSFGTSAMVGNGPRRSAIRLRVRRRTINLPLDTPDARACGSLASLPIVKGHVKRSIPKAGSLPRQVPKAAAELGIVRTRVFPGSAASSGDSRPACRHAALKHWTMSADGSQRPGVPQALPVFDSTSFSIWLSRACSATSRFKRAFSASRALSRRSSDVSRPPYFLFQR
jgi:hypothetical protein